MRLWHIDAFNIILYFTWSLCGASATSSTVSRATRHNVGYLCRTNERLPMNVTWHELSWCIACVWNKSLYICPMHDQKVENKITIIHWQLHEPRVNGKQLNLIACGGLWKPSVADRRAMDVLLQTVSFVRPCRIGVHVGSCFAGLKNDNQTGTWLRMLKTLSVRPLTWE